MAQRNRLSWLVLFMVLISACGPDTIFLRPTLDTPAQHVKNGHHLMARDKIDAAYAEFLRAKDLDPDHVPAHVGIALIQGHRGDVDGGFETLDEAQRMATTPEQTKAVNQGFEAMQQIAQDKDSQKPQ